MRRAARVTLVSLQQRIERQQEPKIGRFHKAKCIAKESFSKRNIKFQSVGVFPVCWGGFAARRGRSLSHEVVADSDKGMLSLAAMLETQARAFAWLVRS